MVDVPANTTSIETFETDVVGNIGAYSGLFDTTNDTDWLRLTMEFGFNYRFFLATEAIGGSATSSTIRIRDGAGTLLAFDSGSGAGENSFLIFSPSATGTFFIEIQSGANQRGAYSILFDRTFFGQTPVFLTGAADTYAPTVSEEVGAGAGDDGINLLTNNGFAALGEQGDDGLSGSEDGNILSGGLGEDSIIGRGGDDVIFGDAGDDRLIGGTGIDQIFGGNGRDDIFGDDGIDFLRGGAGDDVISGGVGGDDIKGGDGDDLMFGDEDADSLEGGDGNDELDGGLGSDALSGEGGNDILAASFGNDSLLGGAGNDSLNGSSDNDTLDGGAGIDTLLGGDGADRLTGGLGKDLIAAGAGLDDFDFNAIGETGKTASTRDRILDFVHLQDDIDLRTIDAKTGVAGNQAFKFIGSQAFHDVKGELHFFQQNPTGTANDKTIVEGDVTGDGKADFQIELKGLIGLTKADFLL